MGVRSVVPILQPRQQSGNQRNLVIKRLGDLEQGLAQSAPYPFAIAEPFEAGRKLDVVIQIINPVAGESLPSRPPEELGRTVEHIAVRSRQRRNRDWRRFTRVQIFAD